MDPQPHIAQGFIEHTLKWALALPVQIRHEILTSARDQAHLNQQVPRGTSGGAYFGDPEVWNEIARRIEEEGHTPAD